MTLVYLDQNALVKLGFKALGDAQFSARINAAIDSGALTIVVSPWHLVEIANTTKIENALKLAEFMDSLRPAWLLERYDVRTLEVHEDFFRFANIDCPKKERVTTRSRAFAALNREPDSVKFNIPSRAWVDQWITHPEQLDVLRKTYRGNTQALRGLRQV